MKYFTIKELCKSSTAVKYGIPNSPGAIEEAHIALLIENVLDPLREAYGAPIIVDSGFRCARLNALVKGSKTSHHLFGMAADIHTVQDTPAENKRLFDLILSLKLPFTQLINEYNYNWVHVSYDPKDLKRQVLKIV